MISMFVILLLWTEFQLHHGTSALCGMKAWSEAHICETQEQEYELEDEQQQEHKQEQK